MSRLRELLAGLPTALRWAVLGVAAVLLVLLVGVLTWSVVQHREASARRAFAAAGATYRAAMVSGEEASLAEAATTLARVVQDYPRSAGAAQAWYYLGNVEYRRARYDAAAADFEEAARRDTGSVGGLSRLGIGYAWEAKHEPAKALAAYQDALKGRGPKDFLYAELLVAVARAQEESKQPAAAIETYRRLVKDAPGSAHAAQARARLAILGGPAA